MRVAWATDIHLDFLTDERVLAFAAEMWATGAEALIVSGDLSNAVQLVHHLRLLVEGVKGRLYFVLGNHDFYGGSLAEVRAAVAAVCARKPRLCWLPDCGVVRLSETTALVGVDGWGDARLGDPDGTTVVLNDFFKIADLAATIDPMVLQRPGRLVHGDRGRLHAALRDLGDAEAARCKALVGAALAEYPEVLVVTHVPPFKEACWHEGALSDENWLPYFTCDAVGVVLRELAEAYPQRRLTVLCGHTHGAGEAQILGNLKVLTGGAEYRRPVVQRVLEVA